MSKMILPTHNGVNAVLFVNNVAVAGQTNCTLNRTMKPITITNKINGTWEESLSGIRNWSLNCTGMFIKNKEAFDQLQQAFYNGDAITAKITDGDREYTGTGLITRFPVSAAYNDAYVYNITILGTGALS